MRTNVVIDDSLMAAVLEKTGLKTKKAAIEAGLKLLAQFHGRAEIRKYRGKLRWSGNLEKMRIDK
jgi:Arc/MetJ family transcription regulator